MYPSSRSTVAAIIPLRLLSFLSFDSTGPLFSAHFCYNQININNSWSRMKPCSRHSSKMEPLLSLVNLTCSKPNLIFLFKHAKLSPPSAVFLPLQNNNRTCQVLITLAYNAMPVHLIIVIIDAMVRSCNYYSSPQLVIWNIHTWLDDHWSMRQARGYTSSYRNEFIPHYILFRVDLLPSLAWLEASTLSNHGSCNQSYALFPLACPDKSIQ